MDTLEKQIKLTQIRKPNSNLCYIHIPKCAGTYVRFILNDLNINYKPHVPAEENDGITFSVIRDPIDRFESLLNYRLRPSLRISWIPRLNELKKDPTISLNEVVRQMTDEEIKFASPFKTLNWWCQGIDILLTLDKLHAFLSHFGYTYNVADYPKKNISVKTRGSFNTSTVERLKKLFKKDVILYDIVTNTSQ